MVLPLPRRALDSLNTIPAQPFPVQIAQVSGSRRVIELRGRSLPYRTVPWGQEQRVEVKYFPGVAVAQSQVLGATWTDTVMRGTWKDVFLFEEENQAILRRFPPIVDAGTPGNLREDFSETGVGVFSSRSYASGGAVTGGPGVASKARVLRDAMWLLQREGQLLKVTWASITRYGWLTQFEANHLREEDIEWELTFKWIGDAPAITPPKPAPKLDEPGLLAKLLKDLQDALNRFNEQIALLYGDVQAVTQGIARIGSLVGGFLEALENLVNLVFAPAEVFGALTQQLTGIILACQDLINTLGRVPQTYKALQDSGNPVAVNDANAAALAIAAEARRLAVEASEQRAQLEEQATPPILGVVTASEGTSLYDVANEYYGAPEDWILIAEFNGFDSVFVESGTLIYVPTRDQGVKT